MRFLLPIFFAAVAAIGNALFALGQRRSAGVENGLLFTSLVAFTAFFLAFIFSPLLGAFDISKTVQTNWKNILISGTGLSLTYFGFNLLYTRYGVSQYALYAVISIITTVVIVGLLWLKEPVNIYHKIAIILALAAVILFSVGQSKL